MTLGELKDELEHSATFDAFRQEHILEEVTVEDVVRVMLESTEMEALRGEKFLWSEKSLGTILKELEAAEEAKPLMNLKIIQMTTVGDVLDAVDAKGLLEKHSDVEVGGTITVGEAVDLLAGSAVVQTKRDTPITVKTTVGKLLDIVGEDKVKTFLEEKAAAASYNPAYEYTEDNVIGYWLHLSLFIVVFAMLAMITLEFIDKDKR